MITKHTPGPWHRNIPPASKYPTIYAGRNTHVGRVDTVGKTPEEIEANADLFSAAPELLEALLHIMDTATRDNSCSIHSTTWHAIEAARPAIAKATGGA